MTYLATVQALQQIQISGIRYAAMDDKHSIVDYCAQRKPSIDFFNKF